MPRKSILAPYYNEIFLLRKKQYSLTDITHIIDLKYDIISSPSMIKNLLDVREKRGIKPSQKDIINLLKKDNGEEKNININRYEKSKNISTEKQEAIREEIKEEKTSNGMETLEDLMQEFNIK